uniref:C-type lectin domain-containing protein n=1 Tax=Sphenodon punctatus TaxID=8508 RepID=A0A8D0GYR3_SPHPU
MKKDWNSSQEFCSAERSHLLVISDAQEKLPWLTAEHYWIGLRKSTDSDWSWGNGLGLNNITVTSNSPVQHCGVLKNGILQASSCEVLFQWICEKSPE